MKLAVCAALVALAMMPAAQREHLREYGNTTPSGLPGDNPFIPTDWVDR